MTSTLIAMEQQHNADNMATLPQDLLDRISGHSVINITAHPHGGKITAGVILANVLSNSNYSIIDPSDEVDPLNAQVARAETKNADVLVIDASDPIHDVTTYNAIESISVGMFCYEASNAIDLEQLLINSLDDGAPQLVTEVTDGNLVIKYLDANDAVASYVHPAS